MEFKFGDRLVHASRPEWGTGVVTAAQNIQEDGKQAQRLTIRFDRAGLKTISTAIAELVPASEEGAGAGGGGGNSEGSEGGDIDGGWLSQLEAGDLNEKMARLPEATRDPFSTLAARIKATLALYRFADTGSALLDWAAMQTGLRDPLTRFNRHELEQYFRRFAQEREQQLKRLMLEARKAPSPEIERVKAEAPVAARDAMRKLHF